MTDFRFMSGPWENSREPTIVHSDPDGGDPHILCVITRIHNPDAIHELCGKANAHDAFLDALLVADYAITAWRMQAGELRGVDSEGLISAQQKIRAALGEVGADQARTSSDEAVSS